MKNKTMMFMTMALGLAAAQCPLSACANGTGSDCQNGQQQSDFSASITIGNGMTTFGGTPSQNTSNLVSPPQSQPSGPSGPPTQPNFTGSGTGYINGPGPIVAPSGPTSAGNSNAGNNSYATSAQQAIDAVAFLRTNATVHSLLSQFAQKEGVLASGLTDIHKNPLDSAFNASSPTAFKIAGEIAVALLNAAISTGDNSLLALSNQITPLAIQEELTGASAAQYVNNVNLLPIPDTAQLPVMTGHPPLPTTGTDVTTASMPITVQTESTPPSTALTVGNAASKTLGDGDVAIEKPAQVGSRAPNAADCTPDASGVYQGAGCNMATFSTTVVDQGDTNSAASTIRAQANMNFNCLSGDVSAWGNPTCQAYMNSIPVLGGAMPTPLSGLSAIKAMPGVITSLAKLAKQSYDMRDVVTFVRSVKTLAGDLRFVEGPIGEIKPAQNALTIEIKGAAAVLASMDKSSQSAIYSALHALGFV